MTLPLLVLAAAAVGHAALIASVVNWSHGLGIRSRWMEPLTALALAILGPSSLAGLYGLATSRPADWPALARIYLGVCLAVSLVVLPVVTALRARRRPPLEVVRQSAPVELAAPDGPRSFIGEGSRSWVLRLPGNESLRPEESRLSITLPSLASGLDGLRILHLTDLHFARTLRRSFFEAVIDEAAREDADLVLLTGDLLDDDACLGWIEPILGRLSGRHGTYAILGNHDIHHDPARIADALEGAGYTVLDGRWERLDVGGVPIAVGGTWAPWGATLPPLGRGDEQCRLVLSHTPDQIGRSADWEADLILSGHNHGGQIQLPVVGPILVPSRYGRWYDEGAFRRGRTLLYVSRGVGAKHPIRYGCPPEFSRIVLRRGTTRLSCPHIEAFSRRSS